MARPSKSAAIDYTTHHDLTHGLLERAVCPVDRPFVLVKDADKKGLRLRVTKAGGKHWQFETRIKGKLFTRALGEWPTVSIAEAKEEAHRLRGLAEKGTDPREIERQQQAEREAAQAAARAAQAAAQAAAEAAQAQATARATTVGEAWHTYLQERRAHWGERHYQDHVVLARAGGQPAQRGTRGRGVTLPGPLHSLMALALVELTPAAVEAWANTQGKARPTSARLAWRLLRAFLSWCSEHPDLGPIVGNVNAAKTRRAREALGKAGTKEDALLREQLPGWFAAVRAVGNPAIAAYLQTLLLIGARPGEVLELRWEDINTQWRGLTIRDKVEGTRVIPLTPYVWHLLNALPRRGEYVFASASKPTQPISKPHTTHASACQVAGIENHPFQGVWKETIVVS